MLYVAAMIAVIFGVDVLFSRDRFWERLAVNVGIVLVFGAFYWRFFARRRYRDRMIISHCGNERAQSVEKGHEPPRRSLAAVTGLHPIPSAPGSRRCSTITSRRQAFGCGRGCEGTSLLVGTGTAAGNVRCRLLPAEHAAAMSDGRYHPKRPFKALSDERFWV